MKWKLLARPFLYDFILTVLLTSNVYAAKPGVDRSVGVGRVFYPNPVASLQDQSLTDENDTDYPALQPAYHQVNLAHLDESGYLRGDWASVYIEEGIPAFSLEHVFLFGRDDDRFEQVMAYYWVTEAQVYIQSLGFGSTLRPVDMESQKILIDHSDVDNSYSSSLHKTLIFSKGGVDDAEDAEVILHEYGHAIIDAQTAQQGGISTLSEAGAITEGFGDYWAVDMTQIIAPTADSACLADWDSVSYSSAALPHCLRRLDLDLHYPEDLMGTNHHDGQIWSRALWDIHNKIGHVQADTVILEAHFGFTREITMPEAALVITETAEKLYGPDLAGQVRQKFEERGILN